MKIYFDENIPYAQEFFADFGELIAFSGRDLSAEQVQDADVLLVRSITKVNQQLLQLNDKIQFVGTATIGLDHIDQDYLAARNINFTNAPGCNAVSVAEYVLSAMLVMAQRLQFDLRGKTVGILGAGNTGSRLAEKLRALGVEYLLCDPLLEAQGDNRQFSSLAQISQCDIISLHVPLTKTGAYPTLHLFEQHRLASLNEQQILINACRGEVIDNQALLALKQQAKGPHLILDVWEKEPNILTELIPLCAISTAHIAGYSLEGKARGTEMLYQALSKRLASAINKSLTDFLPHAVFEQNESASNEQLDVITQRVFDVYDVQRDDKIFRSQLESKTFDYLRKNYPVRREFSALESRAQQEKWPGIMSELGFTIKD
ncbi:4-phosphoerythronate dehydrogenase [Thalassotalea sp. ND16A]|uniref:4-phosphoerythronate dehydrogenase n=1 Tax=Thalassotalea sp. ND16A TaxID=1535422 RepID=UPI00051A09FA|nr:4-phosphoerythronate dehydrogenase [Thalassotalea sp. ND16A]